ncbi:MAG: MarR family winged helix-turn-helix transcriptional regulator [Solirubrobacteraceae bacterium]
MANTTSTPSPPKRPARCGPPLAAATADLLSQVGRSQTTRFSDGLQPLGLRPKHFALLNLIDANEGTSQQQLARRLALEPSGLVGTIDELEAQGIVERRRASTDRRRYELYLSQAGKVKLAEARQITARHAAELLAPLEESELQVLHGFLALIVEAT